MKLNTSAGVTFRVHDVEKVYTQLPKCKTRKSIETILSFTESKPGNPVFACSDYNSEVVDGLQFHSLFAAIHQAFDQHRALTISPDAVWVTILQGLAHHVHLHSEKLRKKLVTHSGRKKLEVQVDIDPASPESDWAMVIEALGERLNIEVAGSEHLLADFTTTSTLERLVSQVCLLDVYESYFEYVATTGCGFPAITLTGTPEDWLRLRQKIELLDSYDIDFWLPHLREIADHFVRASRGDVDLSVWKDMYKKADGYGHDAINGWIVKLVPYLKGEAAGVFDFVNPLLASGAQDDSGSNYAVRTPDLPSGMSIVPFTLKNPYTGNCKQMEMIGGFVGVDQDSASALCPKFGWAMREGEPDTWKFLEEKQIKMRKKLSAKSTSSALQKIFEKTRWRDMPGEFVSFYKRCNGLSVSENNGLKWTLVPLNKIEVDYREVSNEVDDVNKDPKVVKPSGELFIFNQVFLRLGERSDGAAVLLNLNRSAQKNYEVLLVNPDGKGDAVFQGLNSFVAHLAETCRPSKV